MSSDSAGLRSVYERNPSAEVACGRRGALWFNKSASPLGDTLTHPPFLQHVEEVIELLDACEIAREDLTESMESFKFPGVKRHSYTELDTKAKTSFTRQYVLVQRIARGVVHIKIVCTNRFLLFRYNKAVHKAQGVVENVLGSTTIKKGRGKVATAPEDDDTGLGVASDAESEPDNNDEDDVSMFQKKSRGRTAAGSAGGAAKRKPATSAAKKAPAKKRRA